MNKLQSLWKGVEKYLPDILVGTGICLNAVAVVDGIRHTPQAVNILMDEQAKKGEKLTAEETIKAVWKCYIPTGIEMLLGDACIIGGTVAFHKRNASLLALCSLSESTLGIYKDKLVEAVGKEKATEIENDVQKKQLETKVASGELPKSDAYEDGKYLPMPNGMLPCYDEFSGRIFYSRKVDIENAVNVCNKAIIDYDEITLNEFYANIGLTDIPMGEEFGWKAGEQLIEIYYGSHLIDDIPYLMIRFKNRPKCLRMY